MPIRLTPSPTSRSQQAESSVHPRSAGSNIDAFVAACGGAVRQSGKETICRCPAHADENPSLNVCVGDDGRLLIKCRANCSSESIVAAIGWTLTDLMAPGRTVTGDTRRAPRNKEKQVHLTVEAIAAAAARWKRGKTESTHIYMDKDNAPVFGVVRVRRPDGSKDIPQFRPVSGGWEFGGIKNNRPLYRLPELLAAPGDMTVSIFEGEKKADLAATLGLVATSCSQGAGNAKLTDFSSLEGRVVHLFADNDEPGTEHMADVAARAYAAGAVSVRNVTLPNLPPKGDIVDYHRARRSAGATDRQIGDEIRDAIKAATAVDRESAEAASDAGPVPADDEAPAKIADQLVALASNATLFHDEHDDPYATIRVDDHHETWRIELGHFSRWLCSQYYRAFKKAVPPASLTTAISQLSAMAAFDGDRHPVAVRVCRTGDIVWFDLCNETWQAIEITANGWRVVDNPPLRFIRKPGMRALPLPTTGLGNLDQLFDLLRFDDRDLRLLVTAWLVNCITATTSYPILALTGEQGSGKTTFCRALQRLVDPHDMEGRSPPRGEEDIAVAAQHAHLLCYENMSGISQQLSDSLCRVATGAGFAARKLFTDADERQLRFCKPIILNGIDDLATRSDLADRVISVQLEPIPKDRRLTEADLWATYTELQPQLLATILDIVVKVLATPNVDVPLERMAEYSRLGAKVAIALGLPPTAFSDAYRVNRDVASQTALESSSIGSALIRIVSTKRFHGPVQGLLQELQTAANVYEQRHADWPGSPRALGGELRRISPNLLRMGISVTFHGHRRDGHWVTVEETPAKHGHNGHNGHGEAQPS